MAIAATVDTKPIFNGESKKELEPSLFCDFMCGIIASVVLAGVSDSEVVIVFVLVIALVDCIVVGTIGMVLDEAEFVAVIDMGVVFGVFVDCLVLVDVVV